MPRIPERTQRPQQDSGALLEYCGTGNLNQYDTIRVANCSGSVVNDLGYDEDGILDKDSSFYYEWDAENRLIEVRTKEPSTSDDKKLTLGYDYRNRRVWKKVLDWDPTAGISGEWGGARQACIGSLSGTTR